MGRSWILWGGVVLCVLTAIGGTVGAGAIDAPAPADPSDDTDAFATVEGQPVEAAVLRGPEPTVNLGHLTGTKPDATETPARAGLLSVGSSTAHTSVSADSVGSATPQSAAATTTSDDRPIEATIDVDILPPGERQVKVVVNISAPDEYPIGPYWIRFWYAVDSIEVLESNDIQVFDFGETTQLLWTETQHNASITFRYDPTHERSPGSYDFGAGEEWALLRSTQSPAWSDHVEERIEPAGIRGEQLVLIGEHETYQRTVHGQELTLIVPDAAEMDESPTDVVESLAYEARVLRVGNRNDIHYHFVTTTPIRGGGWAPGNNLEVWTRDGTSLSWNTWGHEYVHTRQGYNSPDANWLREAVASYYQRLLAYKQGHRIFASFQRGHEIEENIHGDVVLAEPRTWESRSDYDKGALVLAALDVEIRERTDGERSYQDVMRRLNDARNVDHETFADAVEAVVGEPMDEFMDRYVLGDEIPDVPDDPDRYRTGEFEFDVEYDRSIQVDAPPESDDVTPVLVEEPATVTIDLVNDGNDAAVRPTVDLELPDGWELIDASVGGAAHRWSIDDGTATADVFGPEERATLEVEVVPDRAGVEELGVLVTDEDGNQADDRVELHAIEAPTAAVSVNEFTLAKGEEVRVDASPSDAGGDIVAYEWDLMGDGTIDETTDESAVTFAPETLGNRTVSLRITDEYGLSDVAEIPVTVEPTGLHPSHDSQPGFGQGIALLSVVFVTLLLARRR